MRTSDYGNVIIEREPLYAQVAHQVLQYILGQGLPIGARLPSEREFSEQFEVSRIVIREAMKVLVRNGVVVVQPGRGTFTTDRTTQSFLQSFDLLYRVQNLSDEKLWEARIPLEIVIAGLAAARADADAIAQLQSCIDDMDQSIADIARHVAADERFHLALATATRNELLQALIQPLIFLLREARETTARMPGAAGRASDCHRRLLEAIKRRDIDGAELEMRMHMKQVQNDLATARRT